MKGALVKSDSAYIISLGVLFLVSFLVPVIVAIKSGAVTSYPKDSAMPLPPPFSGALDITGPESFIQITSDPALNPPADPGRDFMIISWFQLKALPEEGERLILLAKFEADSPAREGYAIGVERRYGEIRPMVYWRDSERRGEWLSFTEIAIQPHSWFMLALLFEKQRFLGLYSAGLGGIDPDRLPLAGGYDLGEPIIAASGADLMAGSFRTGFRGRMGTIGIISRADIRRDLAQILNSISLNPLVIPAVLERGDVMLWTGEGGRDISGSKLKVRRVGMRGQIQQIKEERAQRGKGRAKKGPVQD